MVTWGGEGVRGSLAIGRKNTANSVRSAVGEDVENDIGVTASGGIGKKYS